MAAGRPAPRIWRELLAWWAERMGEMLPARLRAGAASPDALLVTLPSPAEGIGAEISLRQRGRETSLGRFGLDAATLAGLPPLRRRPRHVVLRPPPGTVLEREVMLPLAAQHDPHGVLCYELDRLTPFAPEEVAWSWRLEGRDTARGLLRLRLSLLPRAALRSPIEAL